MGIAAANYNLFVCLLDTCRFQVLSVGTGLLGDGCPYEEGDIVLAEISKAVLFEKGNNQYFLNEEDVLGFEVDDDE